MDMDPAERGGVEWVSEFCPVKGSTHYDRLKQQMIHDRLSKLSKQTPFSVLVRI